MKIVVGVDGSADSLEAVRQIGQLVSSESDSVVFYYTPPAMRLPATHAASPEVLEKARIALADAIFNEAKTALPESLRGSVELITGTHDPRQGLVAAVGLAKADLVVVGARGTSPVQKLLLGSVSQAIVHSSPVPVLIARRPPPNRKAGALRVLLSYDASPASEDAAAMLHQFTLPADAPLHVLSVIDPIFPGQIPAWLKQKPMDPEVQKWADAWSREHEAEKQKKREMLTQSCSKFSGGLQHVNCEVREGHPADEVLKFINEQSIDLVALGARRLGAISRLLLGSTSEAVLTHAPCSVLIVGNKEKP